MVYNNINIDPSVLQWVTEKLYSEEGPAMRLRRLARDTEVELLVLGEPWGKGEIGNAFIKDYIPLRNNILKGTKDLGDGMYEIGNSVNEAANLYYEAENDNTQQ